FATIQGDRHLRVVLRAEAVGVFQLVADNPRLVSVARLKRGIEAYQYEILSSPKSTAWFPFFDGKVNRYSVTPSQERKFVQVSDAAAPLHVGERLVIRRLVSRSNRLMAARMDGHRVVKKDLYLLKKSSANSVPSLSFFLGILNSSLLSYLYLARSAS